MGVSKKEWAIVQMEIDHYHSLKQEHGEAIKLVRIKAEGWEEEYKKNPQWVEQKKLTRYKEYKKQKEIEFNIRHKNRNNEK